MTEDGELIDAFVAAFARGEPLRLFREFSLPEGVEPENVAPLLTGPWDADGCAGWLPRRVDTRTVALKAFYMAIQGPLPPLYEQLILTYQFGRVDLDSYRLLANFPPALEGLIKAITDDSVMFRVLSTHALVQFAMGPGADYDPVCFDLSRRSADGDCTIVKLDHEEILNHERIRVVATLAGSFRQLIHQTLAGDRSS